MLNSNVKKILILSANPTHTNELRLNEEVREIQAGLLRARRREQFEIISWLAVRPEDLWRALLEHEPQIVHFSGHGTGTQGLALENDLGEVQLVSTESLARLFKLFKDKIECVLLNACYSEEQAKAIHQHIDYVVGMNRAIGDRAAIEFAIGFYDALGAGRSIEDAFEFGRIAIDIKGIPEYETPVLKSKKDANPQQEQKQDAVLEKPIIADTLEEPFGQVPLDSMFYVERPPIEADCYAAIMKPGALIRVKAARQMGKTSLMTRVLHHAVQQGYRAVPLYFQEADSEVFTSLDSFLQWFCSTITEELNLPNQLADFWQRGALGNKRKCTNYFQQYLLSQLNSPLILGLDEVDLVFQHFAIANDFLPLLRTWHERAKNEAIWKKLRLIIVHSQEVYIPLNINQSPFNVGLHVNLPEFTKVQVLSLVQQHGLHLTTEEIEQMIAMVGGHPYLVRVALYEIARGRMRLTELLQIAPTEEGPYDDHLRRHLLNLIENADLVDAIKQVIAVNTPVQIGAQEAFKLHSIGLVKFQGNAVVPLCNLYRYYFRNRL